MRRNKENKHNTYYSQFFRVHQIRVANNTTKSTPGAVLRETGPVLRETGPVLRETGPVLRETGAVLRETGSLFCSLE